MPLTEGQGLLQSVTFGKDTNFHFSPAHVSGIGVPPPKTQDVNLDHDNGGYAGVDRKGIRSIILPFTVVGTSQSNTMDNFETLAAAFEPVSADVTLELYLPGKHFTCTGRPRGITDDLRRLKANVIVGIGLFVCLTPTLTAV